MGHASAGVFGYSHMLGGYPGGQAEYAVVPFADVGPIVSEEDLPDEQVLFLAGILPTGYMGAGRELPLSECSLQPALVHRFRLSGAQL